MQTRNPILDDIARLGSSVLGVASGARTEAEAVIRARLQALLADMDLVPREEFDAVREMAARAREEQEQLAARVAELEARLAGAGLSGGQAAPKSRPAAKGSAKS